ncbi:MAG: diacylglycerol kinase family lipid kinase [Candidatus Marinimicrobia bacterium]|nr:diacylglycerol kinase family lipid kinase [Candidatus Neomarinimicrobiota bacterium]
MKRVLVIANPAASRGRGAKALETVKRLAPAYSDRCRFDFMITSGPEHATEIARTHGPAYDLVAALGGDGTVNEVVAGLMGGSTPLGLIPIGTGNDFARSARIPRKLKPALSLLCHGEPRPTDVGIVNGRHFVNAVGIGFDGRTNYEIRNIKYLRGPLVILVAIARTIRSWKSAQVTLKVDDKTISGLTYLIGIGNGPSVGGGLHLTPNADLGDGKLEVCHVADISPLKIILNFPRLKAGTIHKLDEVTMLSGKSIVIESEQPLPVHVDGEVLGLELRKLEIQLLPGALQVVRNQG